MRVAIIDNDHESNIALSEFIRHLYGFDADIFDTLENAENYIISEKPDLVFIAAYSGSGDTRSALRKLNSCGNDTVICLIGKTGRDSAKVYTNKCDMFIKKPYSKEKTKECMELFCLLHRRVKKLTVKTFGHFEVFVDRKPLNFKSAKARELFALCIDHCGTVVSIAEAIDKLWPEREYNEKSKRLYRKAVMQINKTLRELDIDNAFRSVRGGCMLVPSSIECDYFLFLNDPYNHYLLFNGQYMIDYPWSEETLGQLSHIALSINPHTFDTLI